MAANSSSQKEENCQAQTPTMVKISFTFLIISPALKTFELEHVILIPKARKEGYTIFSILKENVEQRILCNLVYFLNLTISAIRTSVMGTYLRIPQSATR